MKIEIRQERESDYIETEKMVRQSFWNKYRPGCNEHYMVHQMRKHPAWLPEYSRVAVIDGEIAGLIMYFVSTIKRADGTEVRIASFGPLCVKHKYRLLGLGKKLMQETLALVQEAGFPGVLIIGEPNYYPKIGFIRCKQRGITDIDGNAWDPYMIYEFEKNGMNIPGIFEEPYDLTEGIPEMPPAEYESQFEPLSRMSIPCQFAYPNPTDEKNGYHIIRAEEKPREFDKLISKLNENIIGENIRQNPLQAEFVILNGNHEIGMFVINMEKSKPEITHIYLEQDFCAKEIEEDIRATLDKQNEK